ncbi:hypothetical protein [Streptomyces chryseus]
MALNTPRICCPTSRPHWRCAIADAFNLTPVPAFMRLWWTQYAIARDPELEGHLRDLEARVVKCEDAQESAALLAGYSRLRHQAAAVEPGR